MVPPDCQESSASAVTQSWSQEHAVICELSQYLSAQLKFILLPPMKQQQEAALDWDHLFASLVPLSYSFLFNTMNSSSSLQPSPVYSKQSRKVRM